MRIFAFDQPEHDVDAYGSHGVHIGHIAQSASARLSCMTVAPGGIVGSHPAASHQVFFVVSGSGQVAGADDHPVPIAAGQAAYWTPGEVHTTTSENGLMAIVLEGDDVMVFLRKA